MTFKNLRALKKLVPIASARINKNAVKVGRSIYFHHVEKLSWTGLNKEEFFSRVLQDVKDTYHVYKQFRKK